MSSNGLIDERSRVSVVVPTRNRLALLQRAVASALRQEHVDVEVIVIDDGSTDGTRAWLEGHADPRLRMEVSTSGPSVARARNAGIEAARGEWLAFLDDDDFWAPTYLFCQTEAARGARAALSAASAVVVSSDHTPLYTLPAPRRSDLAAALYAENVLGGPSRVVVRADAIRETGGFDPQLAVLADWDLWIRLPHVKTIASEIEIIRTKHGAKAASIGETIGSAELYRWLGRQYRRAGLRARAAATYLTIGRRYRLRHDMLRGIGVLLGERFLSLTRRGAPPEHVPEWLTKEGAPHGAP